MTVYPGPAMVHLSDDPDRPVLIRGVGSLFVPGPLPGMNEMIAAAKSGGFLQGRRGGRWDGYQDLKREWTTIIAWHATAARLAPIESTHAPVDFLFVWKEKNRKRDKDNVAAGGRKLVLDGLVAAGILPNDGWRCVGNWRDVFAVNGEDPGVKVYMGVLC